MEWCTIKDWIETVEINLKKGVRVILNGLVKSKWYRIGGVMCWGLY